LEWASSSPFQHKTNLGSWMISGTSTLNADIWAVDPHGSSGTFGSGRGQGWQTCLSHIINKVLTANSDHNKGKKHKQIVICQLKPSQNGQIVMCQMWPFWLLICLGKWNNNPWQLATWRNLTMVDSYNWQISLWVTLVGVLVMTRSYNLLCPQNMWMVSPTFFLIGELSPEKNQVKNRNSKTRRFWRFSIAKSERKKKWSDQISILGFQSVAKNIQEFFSSHLVYRLNLPCNEHDVQFFSTSSYG
jgi:hypothetical protein